MSDQAVADTAPDVQDTAPATDTSVADQKSGNWLDGDTYKEFSQDDKKALGKYKTEAEAIKGGLHAMRQVGKKAEFSIDPDAKDFQEKRRGILQKLGLPDGADGYDVKLPEGHQWTERELAEFKAFAHEQGMPNDMLQAFVDYSYERASTERKAAERRITETAKTFLKESFGDETTEMVKYSRDLISEYGKEGTLDILFTVDGKPKNGPLVALLAELGKQVYGESSYVQGAPAALAGMARNIAQTKELQGRFSNTLRQRGEL